MISSRSRRRKALLLLALVSLTAASGCGVFKRGNRGPTATLGERIPVLGFEQEVKAEPELQNVDVVLPTQQVNASWTQPGGDATGSMGHLALAARPSKLWSVSIGSGSTKSRKLNGTPVISENRLFVIDAEAQLSAYNATSGQLLWRKTITSPGESSAAAFGGGVSVLGDRVFASTGFGLAVAFEAASGNELWRATLPTPLRAAPAVDDGRVFVASQDGQLVALAADNGNQLWEANSTVEPAAVMGPGAPAVGFGTVVAGFPSGELFALRVENGRTLWQDQLSRSGRTTALGALSGVAASPVIDRDRVFAISHGGRMVALDLATGQRTWEREFAGVNTPWPAGDWVFALTVDSELVALTRGEGKVRWMANLGNWKNPKKSKGAIQWYGPVLAGGHLIGVSSRGDMDFVDPANGQVAFREKLGAAAHLPPVVANGILYTLTDDGKLTAWR